MMLLIIYIRSVVLLFWKSVSVRLLKPENKYPNWFSDELIRLCKKKNRLAKKKKISTYFDSVFKEVRAELKNEIDFAYSTY